MNSALVVINIQNDFILKDGKAPIVNSEGIIEPINNLINFFIKGKQLVIFIRAWYSQNHIVFKRLGEHCLINSPGACFHNDLNLVGRSVILNNNADPTENNLSAFKASDGFVNLQQIIYRYSDIKNVFITGLCLEQEILATAQDFVKNGFRTSVISDCTRARTVIGFKETPDILKLNNINLINSEDILNSVNK